MGVLLRCIDDVPPLRQNAFVELAAVVDRTVELLDSTMMGRIMQGLISEVAADPELARAYRERVVNRRLEDVRHVVEQGIHRGELRPDLDPEMVTDFLLGPIYYRLFLSGAPLDHGFGERLVNALRPSMCREVARRPG